jgi:hypothetical protein
MQLQSENTNTSWRREDIAQLIEYAKHLQQQNEDMKANVIAMNAKLSNEEAKVRQLSLLIKQLTTPYEERN